MTMLATSRVNRRRSPLADRSIFSAMLAPLKSIVSFPELPSIVSLPSPGSHWNVSAPEPIERDVVAAVAVGEVAAGAADVLLVARAADQAVVAGAAVDAWSGSWSVKAPPLSSIRMRVVAGSALRP